MLCCVGKSIIFIFRMSHLSGQIILPQYLVNSLIDYDKTDDEYSLAPTDDLVRF